MKIFTIIKSKFPTILSILILITIWKIISEIIDSEIIVPSPEETFKSLILILKSKAFLKTVMATVIRGWMGFLLSCILGLIVGMLAGINCFLEKMIQPLLVVIKATPVMSIILIALRWFKTDIVPIFVSFLVAFPIICLNVMEGIKSVDVKIIQMAKIYKVKKWRIIIEIYIPAIMSFLVAGFSTAMGIGWKAVIAAEVLSQPKYAIGKSLQMAKSYIEIADVFAWTAVAILLSFIFENAIRIMENKIVRWR